MRAITTLRECYDQFIPSVHARRREAVWRGVQGLLRGGHLWLTALGRDLPGETSDKHRIKAADRLLGNKALHRELPEFYRGLASWLLRRTRRPVLAIDWSGLCSPFWTLTAALCCEGRALPLYSEVHPHSELAGWRVHRQFLRALAGVLPPGCKPIVLTDAGYYADFFEAVCEMGWDFVGRVRGHARALVAGQWVPIKALYERASRRPQNLGLVTWGRERPHTFRLVLSASPQRKNRKHLGRKRQELHGTGDYRYRSQATEPWLLATSLTSQSKFIVYLYGLRMQIEETFRDEKNFRHGWALRHIGCRSEERIEVLLYIGALALAVVQAVGRAAEELKLHYDFQANTVRKRRVLSWFVLGRFVLRRLPGEIDPARTACALEDLVAIARSHGVLADAA